MEMVTFEPWFMHTIQAINQKMPDVELRDLFAMQAMCGLLQGAYNEQFLDLDEEHIAKLSYLVADEMLKARRKK